MDFSSSQLKLLTSLNSPCWVFMFHTPNNMFTISYEEQRLVPFPFFMTDISHWSIFVQPKKIRYRTLEKIMFMFYEEQVCHYSSAAFLTHQKKNSSTVLWMIDPILTGTQFPPSLSFIFCLLFCTFALIQYCSCRYDYYSFSVIPAVGELVAGDRNSYQYLVESIRRFPSQVLLSYTIFHYPLFTV